MPWLIDTILRLPDLYGIKATVTEIAGYSGNWFKGNPSLLPHFLSELSKTLQIEQGELMMQSAKSIDLLLTDCRQVRTFIRLPFFYNALFFALRSHVRPLTHTPSSHTYHTTHIIHITQIHENARNTIHHRCRIYQSWRLTAYYCNLGGPARYPMPQVHTSCLSLSSNYYYYYY